MSVCECSEDTFELTHDMAYESYAMSISIMSRLFTMESLKL